MNNYKIVKLKGLKFENKNTGIVCEFMNGFALYVENMGFISFKGANVKNTVKTPYTNTRKVLQSIIDDGGLTDFSLTEFLHPIN